MFSIIPAEKLGVNHGLKSPKDVKVLSTIGKITINKAKMKTAAPVGPLKIELARKEILALSKLNPGGVNQGQSRVVI